MPKTSTKEERNPARVMTNELSRAPIADPTPEDRFTDEPEDNKTSRARYIANRELRQEHLKERYLETLKQATAADPSYDSIHRSHQGIKRTKSGRNRDPSSTPPPMKSTRGRRRHKGVEKSKVTFQHPEDTSTSSWRRSPRQKHQPDRLGVLQS